MFRCMRKQKQEVKAEKQTIRNASFTHNWPEDPNEFDHTNDFFARSSRVANLKSHNFMTYLRQQDAALVFFYNPTVPDCCWAKKHVDAAAIMNNDPYRGYAGVNCSTEADLCESEGVTEYPAYKLYSHGFTVSKIEEYMTFTFNMMHLFVKNCPVFLAPRSPKDPKNV